MGRKLRIAIYCLCGLLAALVALAIGLYLASQQVPSFYSEALALDQQQAQRASREMVERATALTSSVKKEGNWQAIFTAEQINGWLAVDRVKNHPDLLPPEFRDPRISIESDAATIACRYSDGSIDSVLSLQISAHVSEPNVIAIRLRRARAGSVPVPMDEVVSGIQKAAQNADLALEWRQVEGDPVALLTIPPPKDRDRKVQRLETLQLRSGEVYVSGRTERREKNAQTATPR